MLRNGFALKELFQATLFRDNQTPALLSTFRRHNSLERRRRYKIIHRRIAQLLCCRRRVHTSGSVSRKPYMWRQRVLWSFIGLVVTRNRIHWHYGHSPTSDVPVVGLFGAHSQAGQSTLPHVASPKFPL